MSMSDIKQPAHTPAEVAPMKNNKKGRPVVPVKKDQRVTFRLTAPELESINLKLDAAGFCTLGAYVREHLCNSTPKTKVIIPVAAMQIAIELQKVANMISHGQSPDLVIDELHNINNKLLGV